MGAEGGARKWFEDGKMADYPSYLTEEVTYLNPHT
jgi:hypothetical protein